MRRIIVFAALLSGWLQFASGQIQSSSYDSVIVDYSNPKSYIIGAITVSGTQYLDKDILIALAGIKVGDKIDIPSQEISKALKNLWKQDLFANVIIYADHLNGDTAILNYVLEERPRLSGFTFRGIKKSDQDDIREKIKLNRGKVLTDNVKVNTVNIIKSFYDEKGYTHASVEVKEVPDSSQQNSMLYYIIIDKGNRVKIDHILFTGNTAVSTGKLHGLMKKTKEDGWLSIFTVSKFKEKEYADDKNKILTYYSSKGYRDARILSDSVYENARGNIDIIINLAEGNKYYFRDIKWSGNTKYASSRLDSVLRIKKGDVYDESYLQKRLSADPNGSDVSSLYMDDGYLFFQVIPQEVSIENDSIDLVISVREGPQATINLINIEGNSKTHERVIRRAIRTVPGSKFSRADVIRSQREILALGFFDPEKLGINTDPHPENGTVNLTYTVV
jgi:outer membrane protein insertion porin family